MANFMYKAGWIVFIQLMVLVVVPTINAHELKSQYATILFKNPALLKKFNSQLYLGRMGYLLDKKNITLEDEVINKVDLITKKIERVLEMYPSNLHYTISLCSSLGEVTDNYEHIYNKRPRYPGFFSPSRNTIFVSVNDLKLPILAHEIGHVIVENYFKVSPPVKIHEILAQFAEKHVTD